MGNSTNLVINEKPDRKKWEEFVLQHPCGNIFQTPFMFDLYQSTPAYNAGVVSLENTEGSIVGLMVYVLIRERGITSAFSNRALVTGGPLICEDNLLYATTLLSGYLKKVKKKNPIYTEVRNLFDLKPIQPAFQEKQFAYEDHLTIHINLEQSAEALEKALHKKRAANIRRAIKKNVCVKELGSREDLLLGYDLIKKTYERINLPSPPLELFLSASEILRNNIKFSGAYLDGKLIGCRVYLIYKTVIYDWYAAVDRDYSGFHASDLMPWSNMLWAKENKLKVYDFAGAGKPNESYSVRDYKLKFGGNLLNLGRYQYIHKPALYRLGVWGIKLYRYIK